MARKKISETPKTEDSPNFKNLYLYISIVNYGHCEDIIKLYQLAGSSAQFMQKGRGTAKQQVLDVLGIEDDRKEIVYGFIPENKIPELQVELDAYFKANKRNKGIAFAIKLTSLVGARLYHFLADTLG